MPTARHTRLSCALRGARTGVAGRRNDIDVPPMLPYLDYPRALAAGWPVATGVIEGARRHLVKDRMAITGARWSTAGAQAILWLRVIAANGDHDAYRNLASLGRAVPLRRAGLEWFGRG